MKIDEQEVRDLAALMRSRTENGRGAHSDAITLALCDAWLSTTLRDQIDDLMAQVSKLGAKSARLRHERDELARLLTEALSELFEVTRDSDRQRSETEAVRKSIQERATALVMEVRCI